MEREINYRTLSVIILAITGMIWAALSYTPIVSATSSDPLSAFLVSQPNDPTALSPQNLGTGSGQVLSLPVVPVSGIDQLANGYLFSSSSGNFNGTGFSANFPVGGFGNLTLQLEGPAGFTPLICFAFKKNLVSFIDGAGGCSGPGIFGSVALGGDGVIVTQTFNFGYATGHTFVVPTDDVELSVVFGISGPSNGQTVKLHYGGGTGQTTSFFQLPVSVPLGTLNAFLVSKNSNSMILSPQNTGSGIGTFLDLPVQSAPDIGTLFAQLFSSPSAVFAGTGFSGTIADGGTGNITLQIEGPQGLSPWICSRFAKNGFAALDASGGCFSAGPLSGSGAIVSGSLTFTYAAPQTTINSTDVLDFYIGIGAVGSSGQTIRLHYNGGTSQTTSFFQLPTAGIPIVTMPESIRVSQFFTDPSSTPLPVDGNGSPRVDVVVTPPAGSGIGGEMAIRSTNPGQVVLWTNTTNTGGTSLEALRVNVTLPVDWSANPPWTPGKGAVQAFFALRNGTRLDITGQMNVTSSSGNPAAFSFTFGNLTGTSAGRGFGPGESILVSVKMQYGLKGTFQPTANYPRTYAGSATAIVASHAGFEGNLATSESTASFKAYAKLVGDVNGDFTVNIVDLSLVAHAFGSSVGDLNWNPSADLEGTGRIDIGDLAIVASHFGSSL